MRPLIMLLLAVAPMICSAQDERAETLKDCKQHILFLASDELEGRDTGSQGEQQAADYIIEEYKKLGLSPAGDDGSFLQPFTFSAGKEVGKENLLELNGQSIKFETEYYPVVASANGVVSSSVQHAGFGIQAPELKHDDFAKIKQGKGDIFLIKLSTPEGENPHSDFFPFSTLEKKVETAKANGARAVIFVPAGPDSDPPAFNLDRRVNDLPIPAVYVHKVPNKLKSATIKVDLKAIELTGKNVLGFLDKGAENTVVIGGHYDHLGYGLHGGSLHAGEPDIHNGADDNASGIAVILELAEQLKSDKYDGNNYLFACFSGEERGLFGSNYYVKNPTKDLASMNYMLNYDMVGRMADNTLLINGVGTSDAWGVMETAGPDSLKIKTTESGVGGSDHTSFYLSDVPAVHYFTGAHSDYHKPSDDEELINYDGIYAVIQHSLAVIDSLDEKGKVAFSKTNNDDSRPVKFTVTLGVIPDYLFDGKGMRIDGIRENKPAANAGIIDGDVVVQMDDFQVTDMQTYMKALSQYSKGDKSQVTIQRDDKKITFEVTF